MTALLSLDAKAPGDPFGLTNYDKLKDDIDLLIRSADGILSPGLYKLWDSTEAGIVFPTASITTPALPQTFKHLHVVATGRGDGAAASLQSLIRINGDTSAAYYYQQLRGNGAGASATEALAQTALRIGDIPGATAEAGAVGVARVLIPNYTDGANYQPYESSFGLHVGTATGNIVVGSFAGVWRQIGGVSTLTFLPSANNLIAGATRYTVYGEA